MEFAIKENTIFSPLRDKQAEELLSFVDKYVRIQLIKNAVFKGFVHSIDPVSYSVILSIPEKESYKTVLIPGHAIVDVTETETTTNVSLPIRKSTQSYGDETKKNQLIAWLKWNMLPVSEDGDKILFGNASLLPPYGITDICTDNPMVAMQMKKIIESMPQDFEAPKS